jgi:hypothetical protein
LLHQLINKLIINILIEIDKRRFLLGLILQVVPNFIGAVVATPAVAVPQVLLQGDGVTHLEFNLVFTLGLMLLDCSL